MIEDRLSLEDLLLATLDAVSRFRVGQRDTVGAALDAGAFLAQAKGRLQHGEWGNWLHRVGLAPRTASMWMKLAGTTQRVAYATTAAQGMTVFDGRRTVARREMEAVRDEIKELIHGAESKA